MVPVLVVAEELRAVVGRVVVLPVVVHGATASLVMNKLDRRRADGG